MTPLLFGTFAAAAIAITRTLSQSGKVAVASRLLASIDREEDLLVASRWLVGDRRETPVPTVASTLPLRVYAALSGEDVDIPGTLDYELFQASRAMAGSGIETVRMLLEAASRAGLPPLVRSEGLSINQVIAALVELGRTAGTDGKVELLAELWRAMDPDEIVVLHALLGRGPIAAGFDDELLAHAISRAFAQPLQLVRHALAVDGDAGRTAVDARHGALEATFVRPLHLVPPMHAASLERAVDDAGAIRLAGTERLDAREYFVEERLAGARIQLHVWPDPDDDDEVVVALLTSSGRDVASSAGALARRLRSLPPGTVIDGQLLLFDADGVLIDAATLERDGPRGVLPSIDEEMSEYVGFDLLVSDGLSLLEQPLEERRFRLEQLSEQTGFAITNVVAAGDRDDLDRLYVETIAGGGRGIILKRRDSAYEFGRRSGAWLKAPGEPATLYGVIRYAAAGPQGAKGPPGELTFGVWLDDGDETRLVNIGRVDCRLDDEDLARLERRLQRLRGKRFGTTYEIEPRIVCELEYDAIRVSPRTDAGYKIRIACIRCVRWDLSIDDAATVADIERRHRRQREALSLERAVVRPRGPGIS